MHGFAVVRASLRRRKGVRVAGAEGSSAQVAERWANGCGAVEGQDPFKVRSGNVTSYTVYSTGLAAWVAGLGGAGPRQLPGHGQPDDYRRGLLAGLVDGAGTLDGSAWTMVTVDHGLTPQIAALAGRLGLPWELGERKLKGQDRSTIAVELKGATWLQLWDQSKSAQLAQARVTAAELERVALPEHVREAILAGLRQAGACRRHDRSKTAQAAYKAIRRAGPEGVTPVIRDTLKAMPGVIWSSVVLDWMGHTPCSAPPKMSCTPDSVSLTQAPRQSSPVPVLHWV